MADESWTKSCRHICRRPSQGRPWIRVNEFSRRAVGGTVDPASSVKVKYTRHLDQAICCIAKSTQDFDDDATELKTYDRKVHMAATEMTRAMTAELRQLGVPFFPATQPNTSSAAGIRDRAGETADSRPSDELKLKELQRRILGLLEDMCRE